MITSGDFPDRRDPAQRERDGTAATAQSAALERANTDQQTSADAVSQLLAKRQAVTSDPAPIQVDVLQRPGAGAGGGAGSVLVAHGQLLLLVSEDPPSPAAHAAAGPPGGNLSPTQQASALLGQLNYTTPVQTFVRGVGLPLQVFTNDAQDAAGLLKDLNDVRTQTGADLDLNYVCTTGHTVKGEDYPVGTAGLTWVQPNQTLPPVTVAVIDTGINRELRTDGWLASIAEDSDNEDPLDVIPGNGVLDDSGGHGTFVSGIVQQIAPQATVKVYRAVDSDGMGPVDAIGAAIVQAAEAGANIINLSLGTPTVDDNPPLAFTTALQELSARYPDVLVVASAGNNGDDTLMFPAAMQGVTGVGALNPDLTAASWSSRGYWVECSAVGVGVTSTFVEGTEQHDDGTGSQQFGPNAWAVWSGTSFSAAQITGAVAQLCQTGSVSPADALAQLLGGKQTLDGFGYLVQLLPGS